MATESYGFEDIQRMISNMGPGSGHWKNAAQFEGFLDGGGQFSFLVAGMRILNDLVAGATDVVKITTRVAFAGTFLYVCDSALAASLTANIGIKAVGNDTRFSPHGLNITGGQADFQYLPLSTLNGAGNLVKPVFFQGNDQADMLELEFKNTHASTALNDAVLVYGGYPIMPIMAT